MYDIIIKFIKKTNRFYLTTDINKKTIKSVNSKNVEDLKLFNTNKMFQLKYPNRYLLYAS